MENLEKLNLTVLGVEESSAIHGGSWPRVLYGVGAAIAAAIISDWDNFKRGLRGMPEIKKN